MKGSPVLTFVAVAAVVAIALAAFTLGQSPAGGPASTTSTSTSPSGGGTSSVSLGGGNQTFVASYVSTTATTTSTKSQPTGGGGSYSYTPSDQVKVLAVRAVVAGSQGGPQFLSFAVDYQNIGTSAIHVLGGGGSSLNSTIVSGVSAVSRIASPRCELVLTLITVAPGANMTSVTPGCWSGFGYQLDQGGSIQVLLTLEWSNGTGGGTGAVRITADFVLA